MPNMPTCASGLCRTSLESYATDRQRPESRHLCAIDTILYMDICWQPAAFCTNRESCAVYVDIPKLPIWSSIADAYMLHVLSLLADRIADGGSRRLHLGRSDVRAVPLAMLATCNSSDHHYTLSCEQPGVYVFDTTSLSWKTQYTAGTVYTTPDNEEIASLAGGRGTGSSTSGSGFALGGTGADDEDTSASFPKSGGSGSGGGGSNTGAIAGGVVGGLAGLTIILGLLYFFWRKKKRQEREAAEAKEKEKLGLSTNTSPGSNLSNSNPYEEQMRQSMAADDDVEEATQGYNAQFR